MVCPMMLPSVVPGKAAAELAASAGRSGCPTPTTRILRAPRCIAGESGEICRMEPSPKNSRCPSTHKAVAGNRNGMALEAIKCSMLICVNSERRPGRLHPSNGAPFKVWQNVQCVPLV